MKPEIKEVIDWLLAQGLSPLPVAPQQDSRKYPKINLGNGKNYDHCPLDENLNPIPLYNGKNPSYLNKLGEPNLVNHSNYQNKQPSESIMKRWFQNENNGIGALGKDDFCWFDLDTKCFESPAKFEAALNKIFDRCPELMNGVLEKTHSGGFRLGFGVKEPKSFTNFAVEIGGKHAGELLGAGRFAVLAPSRGPSGNFYINISRPEKLPIIEKIDFVYPVGQVTTEKKPVKPQNRKPVNSSGESLDLVDLLSPDAFAAYQGEDIRNDGSGSLVILIKDAKGWENWLSEKNIPFTGDSESLIYSGGSNLGLDDARCERIIKSVKNHESLTPAAFFKGGDKACWLKIFKLSKQVYGDYCPASMKDQVCGKLEKIQVNPQTGEVKMTDAMAIAILEKELDGKPVKVKTTKPLQEPKTYTDDPSPEKPAEIIPTEASPITRYLGYKDLRSKELLDFVDYELGDRLSYDELRCRILMDGKELKLGTDIEFWFLRNFNESANANKIFAAIVNCAKENTFNPVVEYLNNCRDAEPVPINDLASRYFGQTDPIYNRMVEMWLISGVARALDPGCQADSALVLQGGQGKGKSTWFKTLFGEFFTDSVNKNNFGTPNALMTVHTIWGVELAELDSIVNSKEAGQIKSFITARADHMRKPYLREIDEFKRPCIFCATVNPSRFLVDDENRRFWPIPIPDDCDLQIGTLQKERDGIWLSALRAYEATKGQKYAWWPTDPENAEIRRVTGDFEDIDVWQDVIEEYLDTPDQLAMSKMR